MWARRFQRRVRRIGRENRGVAILLTEVTPRYLDVPITAVLAYLALC